MAKCPPTALLLSLLEGQSSPEEQTAVGLHVETCLDCQGRLEHLTRGFSSLRGMTDRPPASSVTTKPSASLRVTARPLHAAVGVSSTRYGASSAWKTTPGASGASVTAAVPDDNCAVPDRWISGSSDKGLVTTRTPVSLGHALVVPVTPALSMYQVAMPNVAVDAVGYPEPGA